MKIGRYAQLSAAIVATLYGVSQTKAQSRNLTWDPSGVSTNLDGSGNWDTSSLQWYDPGTTAVVSWSNANPDSATFGTSTVSGTVSPYTVNLNANITVLNMTIGNAASTGSFYNFGDQGDGNETLTLNGNFLKDSTSGGTVFNMSSPIALSSGNHIFTLQDSPGDAPPEVTMNNGLSGTGALTLDDGYNSSGFPQWGTMVLNTDSTYSGGTSIVKGRLVANTAGGLGSGTVTISSQGNLSFGGAGTSTVGSLTINNPIVITRNIYTGTDYSDYPDALTSSNPGNANNTLTLNGPFVVDSTNAQIAADTSTINIPGNITQGPDVTNGMLTVDGDFAGYVTLGGNNSALTGGIQVIGGVELNVTSVANLGGATATLIMNGSGTFHPVNGALTSFGSLNVNYSTFNGGVDVDPNQTFTISQNLGTSGSTSGSVGMRGAGTLNLSGTDNLGGSTFWDGWSAYPGGGGTTGGVVNVTGTVALGSLHLRSPVVNVTGVLTLNDPGGGQYNSFGSDTTGTLGGPDMAVVNISGNGVVDETTGDDFNISDNANTTGTINISGNGSFITGGITWLGKSNGATGTINQNGGSFTINRSGNFGFVIADGRGSGTPTGHYNLNSGTFTDENGEIYVGEGHNGTGYGVGYWTQTGGTATFGNWFVVGREGAMGTVLVSGGTLTKDNTNGGADVSIGEGSSNVCTMTVDGTGVFTENSGQFFVGNSGGTGVLNVGSLTDPGGSTPSVTVDTWFAVGRGNGGTSSGTLNLYDGTVTQAGSNYLDIAGDGGTATTGVVNVYGGQLNALNTWIGENSNDSGTLNMNGGAASLGNVELALGNTANGTINLNAGTLTAASFTALNNGGTGIPKFFFNGGTVQPSAATTNFIGAKVTSVVSTGGAKINTNGFAITVNTALKHDTSLTGADGGLAVSGTGTLTLASASNTYNGGTSVASGASLVIATAGALPAGSPIANNGLTTINANSTSGKISGSGTLSIGTGSTAKLTLGTGTGGSSQGALNIAAGSTLDIGNNHLVITYGSGSDPINSIAAWVASGYAGGAWTGTGITSNAAAANAASYGIGYADYADPGNPAGLSSGQIEIAYTLLGDANLDDKVNGTDFTLMSTNFNDAVTNGWDKGDFNYSNTVNGSDFLLLANNFNQFASQSAVTAADLTALDNFAAANGISLASVPEPASIGLLAVGGLGLLRRRRRNG